MLMCFFDKCHYNTMVILWSHINSMIHEFQYHVMYCFSFVSLWINASAKSLDVNQIYQYAIAVQPQQLFVMVVSLDVPFQTPNSDFDGLDEGQLWERRATHISAYAGARLR